ncbi:type IV pilin-like G/H family protein [Scytonema sp. NUACC26]|uniref:type IV pilin-like G/H family protein n=1 Tax=Scytonema sp. NUACC26 TaxID=3140176 RepID=UPI0034DCA95F
MLKPELQVKFLQHLNRKKRTEEGFTLIELLVVVIIIGVLAAIALPSLLGQVNKAKQSEAKNYVGASNRAQQAYYLEYQLFASSLPALQVGIKNQTDNYSYAINGGGYSSGTIPNPYAQIKAVARKNALKSYYGVAGTTVGDVATSEALTVAVACESLSPTTAVANSTNYLTCDNNYTTLAR